MPTKRKIKPGNLQGQKAGVGAGKWRGSVGIFQDEVPDKEGLISIAIEDVIVSVPVGDLTSYHIDRHVPGMPIVSIVNLLVELRRIDWEMTIFESYLQDFFDKNLQSGPARLWASAFFVTNPGALEEAQKILDATGYNIQKFGFRNLKESLWEYHNPRKEETS